MADRLIVRTDQETLDKWTRHAKADGKTLSDWVRATLDAAVSAPVFHSDDHLSVTLTGDAGPAVPINRKLTPAEIAALIPGVSRGLPQQEDPVPLFPADTPEEDVEAFDWQAQFAKWRSRGDAGAEEATEHLQGLQLPVQFWQKKTDAARITWLEENRPNG